jgi:Fur family transcriptional regulator, peroxide stress response regulator
MSPGRRLTSFYGCDSIPGRYHSCLKNQVLLLVDCTVEIALPDSEIRLQELLERIHKRGGRLTPQRVAVLKVLAGSEDHPSVEQIYDRIKADFPTTSLATVYKTVSLLKEMGEVLELGFADGSNRYDGNKPYPHPHLICTRCGEIRDLHVPALSEIVRQASQDVGYRVVNHRLDFYGICPECQGTDPP